ATTAVALSVLAMHYLRCLHPPGGAAALVPVVNPEQTAEFILNPVLIGALALMSIAVLFNALFAWRRYSVALVPARHRASPLGRNDAPQAALNHEDIAWALQQMDSYIDIYPEDLCRLFELASTHQRSIKPSVRDIAMHGYY